MTIGMTTELLDLYMDYCRNIINAEYYVISGTSKRCHTSDYSDSSRNRFVRTAKLSVENKDGLLNNRTCAVKYHFFKSELTNLQVTEQPLASPGSSNH